MPNDLRKNTSQPSEVGIKVFFSVHWTFNVHWKNVKKSSMTTIKP